MPVEQYGPDRESCPDWAALYDVHARARWVLLPDALALAGRHPASRPGTMHRRNPVVESMVSQARSLLIRALSDADILRRPRDELVRLVSAIIDDVAANRGAGLSPEERIEAVADILDQRPEGGVAARPAAGRGTAGDRSGRVDSGAEPGPSSCRTPACHL